MTDAEVDVAWHQVQAALTRHVPGLPANATAEFDVTRHGLLDHFQREALRFMTLDLNPDLDPVAVETVSTLGELVMLIGPARLLEGRVVGRDRDRFRTSRVQLVPLEPKHYSVLYLASSEPQQGFRWRYRGRTPSPDDFQRTLFAGVITQFMVETRRGDPVGLVVAYDDDPGAGHCQIGFIRCGDASAGSMVEAMGLFLSYLFRTFPYRKVFADLPEYNLSLVDGLSDNLVTIEGRLTDYFWHGGQHWDRCFVSVSRDIWEPYADVVFPHRQ